MYRVHQTEMVVSFLLNERNGLKILKNLNEITKKIDRFGFSLCDALE